MILASNHGSEAPSGDLVYLVENGRLKPYAVKSMQEIQGATTLQIEIEKQLMGREYDLSLLENPHQVQSSPPTLPSMRAVQSLLANPV